MLAKNKIIDKFGYPLMILSFFVIVGTVLAFVIIFFRTQFDRASTVDTSIANNLSLNKNDADFLIRNFGVSKNPIIKTP